MTGSMYCRGARVQGLRACSDCCSLVRNVRESTTTNSWFTCRTRKARVSRDFFPVSCHQPQAMLPPTARRATARHTFNCRVLFVLSHAGDLQQHVAPTPVTVL